MADVRPFLQNVLRGRSLPPQRLAEVISHYELFRGHSPLTEITRRQASALQTILEQDGPQLPVYVGMRNWHPYLHETLTRMAADGVRHAIGVILSAQQSEAGWERYQADVAAARVQVGAHAPTVTYASGWHDHPLFIAAVADLTARAFARLSSGSRAEVPLIFTAHSVPLAMPATSRYVRQVWEGAQLVAEKLKHPRWTIAYQSRSGGPRTPWLEPDIKDVLQELAGAGMRQVVVVPIGFVCDHIEVLYDLDTEAQQVATAHGLRMIRAGTVNDHPLFIRMLADVVRRVVSV